MLVFGGVDHVKNFTKLNTSQILALAIVSACSKELSSSPLSSESPCLWDRSILNVYSAEDDISNKTNEPMAT